MRILISPVAEFIEFECVAEPLITGLNLLTLIKISSWTNHAWTASRRSSNSLSSASECSNTWTYHYNCIMCLMLYLFLFHPPPSLSCSPLKMVKFFLTLIVLFDQLWDLYRLRLSFWFYYFFGCEWFNDFGLPAKSVTCLEHIWRAC